MWRWRLIKTIVIYADGLPDESLDFIINAGFIQHIAPHYLDEARKNRVDISGRFVIPNFVDVEKFRPNTVLDSAKYSSSEVEKNILPRSNKICISLREKLGIPEDAFVILSVANIDKTYKRVDYLIKEVKKFCDGRNKDIYLVICGAKRNNSEELIQMGNNLLGTKVRFLLNETHEEMPEIYAAADVFVMCSVNEVFGIAFIEAMACAVPAIGHIYPPTQWVIGSGGDCTDMAQEGALTTMFEKYLNREYRIKKGKNAREEVINRFAKHIVVEQIVEMYEKISK